MEQFLESLPGSGGASFTVTGGLLHTATNSLKRVTGRILKTRKCFQRSNKNFFLKVWWQDATLFVYFSYFYNIHSFNHIHTIHLSVTIRRGLSPSPHRL
jgi:hypothetical protein